MTPATAKMAPATIQWEEGMVRTFNHFKCALCDVCVLTVPTPNDQFVLQTDAFLLCVGAVLSILREEVEFLVSFYARQTRGSEKNCSATELEALGVMCAIEHSAHYLFGRDFVVYTDHKASCSLLSSKCLNRRLQHMELKLQPWSV